MNRDDPVLRRSAKETAKAKRLYQASMILLGLAACQPPSLATTTSIAVSAAITSRLAHYLFMPSRSWSSPGNNMPGRWSLENRFSDAQLYSITRFRAPELHELKRVLRIPDDVYV